jgi:hypothetical protein
MVGGSVATKYCNEPSEATVEVRNLNVSEGHVATAAADIRNAKLGLSNSCVALMEPTESEKKTNKK